MFSWHVPAAEGAAVRRVTASGGYPAQQPARALFLAVQPGSATLSTVDDTACLHAHPACLPPPREWRVTVVGTRGCERGNDQERRTKGAKAAHRVPPTPPSP